MFVAMPGAEPVPAPPPTRFHESNLWATPIRDLGLTIAGTPLQPIIEEAGGVFTDWLGVPTAFGGSAVATNRSLADDVRALLAQTDPSPSP